MKIKNCNLDLQTVLLYTLVERRIEYKFHVTVINKDFETLDSITTFTIIAVGDDSKFHKYGGYVGQSGIAICDIDNKILDDYLYL